MQSSDFQISETKKVGEYLSSYNEKSKYNHWYFLYFVNEMVKIDQNKFCELIIEVGCDVLVVV